MPFLDVNYRGTRLWDGSIKTGLEALYERKIGVAPDRSVANDLTGQNLVGLAYRVSETDVLKPCKEKALLAAVETLLDSKPGLVKSIQKRRDQNEMFDRGSILLVYFLVERAPFQLKNTWPTLPNDLAPIFTDCGISFGEWDR